MRSNKEWLDLVNSNEDKIIEVGVNAYKEAMYNKHLRFIVEMSEDGDVYSWYDVAGGNSYHISVHNGTAIELLHFCFQHEDLEITQEDIINKLIEMGFENRIEELTKEAIEENTDFPDLEWAINNHNDEELIKVLEECRKDAIAFAVSEYAPDAIEQKLELKKLSLEMTGGDINV